MRILLRQQQNPFSPAESGLVSKWVCLRILFCLSLSGPAESGLVSKWRPKDRMKTGCVALVLCLNISVDRPNVIKISPCARMECWIDPFSMAPQKSLETIGKTLNFQYER
ncbi:hypothetical protein Lser_V15G31323 [Lactuca serriola]